MINRTLIRQKVVQILYAYTQGSNSADTPQKADKELMKSLDKAYELYLNLVSLPIHVTRLAEQDAEDKENLNRVTHRKEVVSHRFVDNKYVCQLYANQTLVDYFDKKTRIWEKDPAFVRSLWETIQQDEAYIEYMNETAPSTLEEDAQLWRRLYKTTVIGNEQLDQLLEDQSVYWNDDKAIIDTFVLKTIKRFVTEPDEPLLPKYKDISDQIFAVELLGAVINEGEKLKELISKHVLGWEFERLALMDVVIMQTALAEMFNFQEIPVSVSINEYVEIAKAYSTPKSYGYVNGVLDAVVKDKKIIHKS